MQDNLSPFNGLSPAEAERLHLLIEECGEVIQACTKALRHGLDSYHPNDDRWSNREIILREIADVSAVMTILLKTGMLPHPPTDEMIYAKLEKLKKFTHHQEDSN